MKDRSLDPPEPEDCDATLEAECEDLDRRIDALKEREDRELERPRPCAACGQPIHWGRSYANGSAIPLNPDGSLHVGGHYADDRKPRSAE